MQRHISEEVTKRIKKVTFVNLYIYDGDELVGTKELLSSDNYMTAFMEFRSIYHKFKREDRVELLPTPENSLYVNIQFESMVVNSVYIQLELSPEYTATNQ